MENIEEFYERTKNAMPHDNVKKIIKMEVEPKKAIDLGCGTGRDTVYLIKNNWNVISIDRNNTEEIIKQKLDKNEISRFKFICQNFENMELEKNKLVIANFSIPFCDKNNFNELWKKIVDSIDENRIFCWKLLRIK